MIQVTKGKMKLLLTSEDMCGFMCRKWAPSREFETPYLNQQQLMFVSSKVGRKQNFSCRVKLNPPFCSSSTKYIQTDFLVKYSCTYFCILGHRTLKALIIPVLIPLLLYTPVNAQHKIAAPVSSTFRARTAHFVVWNRSSNLSYCALSMSDLRPCLYWPGCN